MFIRILVGFAVAVAVAEILAAAASTQFVLARLAGLGVAVPLSERTSMTLHDIAGMASMYAPIITLGFLIAFAVTALALRYLSPAWQTLGYPVAGATAIVTAIVVMIALFDVTPIAGARSVPGLICQGLAGAAGGYVFGCILPSRTD